MNVTRVYTGIGSHINPPLKATWTKETKLQWKAAVVRADTGLDITVTGGGRRHIVHGYDRLCHDSHGCGDFHDTWAFLNGVSFGAHLKLDVPGADQ